MKNVARATEPRRYGPARELQQIGYLVDGQLLEFEQNEHRSEIFWHRVEDPVEQRAGFEPLRQLLRVRGGVARTTRPALLAQLTALSGSTRVRRDPHRNRNQEGAFAAGLNFRKLVICDQEHALRGVIDVTGKNSETTQ
jgi:hypothetical protein